MFSFFVFNPPLLQKNDSTGMVKVSFDVKYKATPIISANRKTELCKNYPHCKYGDKCAFAHGEEELRKLSLTEMENTGRIPKASKFRYGIGPAC